MKLRRGLVLSIVATGIMFWSGEGHAYRPFDGTDAAVADTGKIEIELGPVEYLKQGPDRTLLAPSTVVNYGVAPDWEVVVQGDVTHRLSTDARGSGLANNAALLKTVLREGGLQEQRGPSIATEFGVLLPGVRDDHGIGGSLAGIISQQWEWGTLHLNVMASVTRQQHADLFASVIAEGPHDWPVRPVAEVFGERDFGAFVTRSALIGAIWQVKDDISADLGLRGARMNGRNVAEIRAGITFAFGAP